MIRRPVTSSLKRLTNAYRRRVYHASHRRAAHQALRVVEGERGKTSAATIDACNDYAASVLGWRGYAPWLHVYAAVAGEFREGWIPDNYYGHVVLPLLKGAYGEISALKTMTNLVFRSKRVPDIALLVNGLCVTVDGEPISSSELPGLLFSKADRVVFKGDGSSQGRGVTVLDSSSFAVEALSHMGNGVFQAHVKQHSLLSTIFADAVATLRLTTVCDDRGEVSMRAGYLRVGTREDTYVRSASSVRIPIDRATGEFREVAYTADWRSLREHPDSKVVFRGLVIPEFRACVDAVVELHETIRFVRCVGWDVSIDERGEVVVLEWNGDHNGIKFSEATTGPCFADLGWETLWRDGLARGIGAPTKAPADG